MRRPDTSARRVSGPRYRSSFKAVDQVLNFTCKLCRLFSLALVGKMKSSSYKDDYICICLESGCGQARSMTRRMYLVYMVMCGYRFVLRQYEVAERTKTRPVCGSDDTTDGIRTLQKHDVASGEACSSKLKPKEEDKTSEETYAIGSKGSIIIT